MRPTVVFGGLIVSAILVSIPAWAAVVTVDVTIKAVNPQSRGITVVYKTELGEKTIELDVSRKAEITVNGKEGTIETLGPGLKGKVSYDKDLAVVTKIEATGTAAQASKAPEMVAVSELNDSEANRISHLSEDGLTVYWVQQNQGKKSSIWTARRDDPQSLFTNEKELLPGGCASVSSDGLDMILLGFRTDGKDTCLWITNRSAPDKAFRRPQEIPELAQYFAGDPCLSPDGLSLYFVSRSVPRKSESDTIVFSTRTEKAGRWSDPKPVYKVAVEDGALHDPFITPDGLHLFCSFTPVTGKKSNLMVWSRTELGRPFVKSTYIRLKGLPPLIGRNPKYVAATNELFFSRISFENQKQVPGKSSIWVVKNFKVPVE